MTQWVSSESNHIKEWVEQWFQWDLPLGSYTLDRSTGCVTIPLTYRSVKRDNLHDF